ncbi:MAG: vanadium-dependent haloperoxidase, partial [Parvularculaceae bacterium]|nr:vanadium-dependent haloperoxidase [Parvularculaceae bacterium]
MGLSLRAKALGGAATALATIWSGAAFAADNVVLQWNEAVLQAIREVEPGPTIVARSLNVVQTCVYDAWSAYDSKAINTQFKATGSLRRPKFERSDLNKREAISFAAYRAAVSVYPTKKPIFDALMASLGYNPANTTTDRTTPAGVGNVACNAVLNFRLNDGANQLGLDPKGTVGVPYSDTSGYVPANPPAPPTGQVPVNPARWEPLIINGRTQKFLTPHWGGVAPFALKSLTQYKIKDPAKPGTAAYLQQAQEVVDYSAGLTDAQKTIAEYWADGPSSELPPGHWNLFAKFVSTRDNHNVDEDVKMFFALNNALLDASVWTWGQKRIYDYIRPVSAIHFLFAGKTITAWKKGSGVTQFDGILWRPYQADNVVTPPFPEYVSGHSTFSAAAAQTLRLFTKSDAFGFSVTFAPGSSRVEPGLVPAAPLTLSWPTFSAAAAEAGISRRYGGIHFIDGDLEGRRIGK